MLTRDNNIKSVAIYSRKSRPEETDDALKAQLAFLIDMCVRNDWEYEIFQEVGSSQDMGRPELNKMLEKVKEFCFDAVVVTDQDRLSRNTGGFGQIKDILMAYGVKVVTSTKTFDYDKHEDDLMSDMYSIVAKQEYLNIRRRLTRGKRQAAKDGKRACASAPYGYQIEPKTKKLIVDPDVAPMIQKIFSLYLDGYTTSQIQRIFEVEGILTPKGTVWASSRIAHVLKNAVYKGTYVFGKTKLSKTSKFANGKAKQISVDESEQIIIENSHEPIISVDDWEKARQIREKRITIPPGARHAKVAFTRLIKCALCGNTLTFTKMNNRKNRLRIKGCTTKYYTDDTNFTICENRGANVHEFESIFYEQLSKYVVQLKDFVDVMEQNLEKKDSTIVNEKSTIESQMKKIDAAIKKVQQGFIMDLFTDEEAQKQMKQLRAQRKHLEQDLIRVSEMSVTDEVDTLKGVVKQLEDLLLGQSDLPVSEVNDLLHTVIDYIEYKRVGSGHNVPIEITIHYKNSSV